MIKLTGNPKSTQHCYKHCCRGNFPSVYMDKKCKDIKEGYQWEAKSQWKKEPLEGDIEAEVKLYFGTKRKVDIDNFSKLLFDSLTGIVYLDDSQITKLIISKHYSKEEPRIEVTIKQL